MLAVIGIDSVALSPSEGATGVEDLLGVLDNLGLGL